jgi:predicted site-specific integrase-resolvase
VAELVAIIYSFCARLYGLCGVYRQRRAKQRTESIVKELAGHASAVTGEAVGRATR